jgi:two-component system, OmpR family, alkaline phosphatase synthesis response regulator PhoP
MGMAGESILVVEDTELLRRIYQDKLTQEGYNVLTAQDGLEALNMIHVNKVDLVLLDLIMPRMSGLEALEAMKSDPRTKDVPVIILSNLGQDADIQRGLDMGASDYLIKNAAKPADVSAKISSILRLASGRHVETVGYRLKLRDREADADRLVADAGLTRRFWCPTCEVELELELLPRPDRPGWFDAHLVCPDCPREFGA